MNKPLSPSGFDYLNWRGRYLIETRFYTEDQPDRSIPRRFYLMVIPNWHLKLKMSESWIQLQNTSWVAPRYISPNHGSNLLLHVSWSLERRTKVFAPDGLFTSLVSFHPNLAYSPCTPHADSSPYGTEQPYRSADTKIIHQQTSFSLIPLKCSWKAVGFGGIDQVDFGHLQHGNTEADDDETTDGGVDNWRGGFDAWGEWVKCSWYQKRIG